MKLYYHPVVCSLASHIVLNASGLTFSTEQVDIAKKVTASGQDFLKINGKGQVPTLELDDGSILTENAVILQYIADKVPEKNLIPAIGTIERYHLMEWLNFIATELHKGFAPLFNSNTPDAYKTIVIDGLTKKFAYLNERLAEKNYIMGDTFTVADAYLFTVFNWAPYIKLDLSPYKTLQAYLNRLATLPFIEKTLKDEKITNSHSI